MSCELYTIDKIPDNCKYPLALIQAAQNQKQTITEDLVKFLKLNIGRKVILTVNNPVALIQAAQNQKQTITEDLVKFLKLKTGRKVMVTVNRDIEDRLIKGQT